MTQPNFNRVARIYRWAEYLTLGPLLQRTRTHFLPQLTSPRRAFVLGEGDGRFLAELLRINPDLRALAIDTSADMLNLLTRRCHAIDFSIARRLRTVRSCALAITPAYDTDLIVTHFFLDCLTQPEVETLTLKLARRLQPGTLWLLSDFRIPDTAVAPVARLYIRALYFAFRMLTGLRVTHLPDPQKALAAAGFQRIASHERLFGVLYTELWQLDQRATRGKIASNRKMSEVATDRPAPHLANDALPDPEPATPSLAEPDPGVFHHEIAPPGTTTKKQP